MGAAFRSHDDNRNGTLRHAGHAAGDSRIRGRHGGGGEYHFGTPIANGQERSMDHGLLKLTLTDSAYRWQFIRIPGDSACGDSGTAV